ncbi:MAG: hypothetical protein K2W82_04840 [Candidatus Obscuribacterales bacterium]|nr:hypothetical protein [Candidatus Obscuribacterales bacterium]
MSIDSAANNKNVLDAQIDQKSSNGQEGPKDFNLVDLALSMPRSASNRSDAASTSGSDNMAIGDQLALAPSQGDGSQGPKDVIGPSEIQRQAVEAERKEAEKFIKALEADGTAGKWSDASKNGFKKLLDDIQKHAPDATADDIAGILNQVGAGINDRLEAAGSENRIGMAVQPNADGSTSIHMLINNSETKLQNVLGIAQGKDTDSSIKVATIPKK